MKREFSAPHEVIYHPIVREAIKAHGITPEKVVESDNWRNGNDPYMSGASRMDVPFLFLGPREGQVEWGIKDPNFEYSKTPRGYEFWMRVRGLIPESLKNASIGEKLSMIIDVPGADEVIISRISSSDTSSNPDNVDTLITIKVEDQEP